MMVKSGAWRVIQLLYYVLLGSVILFLGLVSAYVKKMGILLHVNSDMNDILSTVAIIIGVAAYIAAKLYDNLQLKKLKNSVDNLEKISWFRNSLIIQVGIMEFASQTVIFFYLLTGNYLTLTPLIITLGVMIFIRPDIYKASKLLNISKEDIEQL